MAFLLLKIQNLKNYYFHFLDNLIKKFPLLDSFLFYFFDISSRITYYLYIDLRFYIPIVCNIFGTIILSHDSSIGFVMYLYDNGLTPYTLSYAFTNILNIYLKIAFLYIFVSFQIIVTNMQICLIPTIRQKLIKKYGDNIFKKRGYNTIARTLTSLTGLTALAVCAYPYASMQKELEESRITTERLKGYKIYVDAQKEHNGLLLELCKVTGKPVQLQKIVPFDDYIQGKVIQGNGSLK